MRGCVHDGLIRVRVNEALVAAAAEKARSEGMTLSELVRQAVAKRGGPRTTPATTRGMPSVVEPAAAPEPEELDVYGLGEDPTPVARSKQTPKDI